MNNQDIKFSKFITPSDFAAVGVIIVGILTAVFFEEIAIRMIGVSIAILGAVAMFMLISQRLSEVVDNKYSKAPQHQPEFTMTTTQDSAAKRQTIEDFKQSFGDEDDYPISVTNPKADIKDEQSRKSPAGNLTPELDSSLGYNDNFSGMKIVRTFKTNTFQTAQSMSNPSESRSATNVRPNTEVAYSQSKSNITPIQSTQTVISQPVPNTPPANKISTSNPDLFSLIEQPVVGVDTKAENEHVTKSMDILQNKPDDKIIEEPKNAEISNYKGKVIDLPMNVFMETDQLLGDEPRKEFEYFMTRVLMIIRSSTDTRTALFMLYNCSSEELVLESFVTTVPLALNSKLKFKLGNDIISQIVRNSKPQILSEINPAAELDLIPYYNNSTKTSSLIGVPVFWGEGIIGVLVADSESSNAYDSGTVAFLGHFTKLVGAIVKSYTHKFDLLQSSKTLEAINMFYSISDSTAESSNFPDRIADTLKNLFPNAEVGLCGFNSENDNWQIKAFRGSGKDITGMIINLEETAVGKSIYQCRSIQIGKNDNYTEIRINANESKLSGDFIATPIKSSSQIFGSVFLELNSDESFTEFDKSVIELIGDHAGNNIEKIYLYENLNNSAIYHHETGLLNPQAFYRRIQEELSRARDFKSSLTLCLFKFDKYASLDPEKFPQRFEYSVQLILSKIMTFLKEYDIFGNVDDSTYGILFIGKESNQARMIAERIRAYIANTIIEHGGGRFSLTISLGLVSPSSNFDIDILVKDALTGLSKAFEQGNQMQVLY